MNATQAQRASWQRRAAHTLTTILREHPHLPVIAWTVTPASAALTAHLTTASDPHHCQRVFTAWTTALHLTERHTRCPGDIVTRLWAHGHLDGTRINLSATTTD